MSDEKRLEEIELKLASAPGTTISMVGFERGTITWLIQIVRTQARELDALKEPMACGHPRACIVYRREIPQNANEPEVEACAWCESEKALRERAEKAEAECDRLAQENKEMRTVLQSLQNGFDTHEVKIYTDTQEEVLANTLSRMSKLLSAHPAASLSERAWMLEQMGKDGPTWIRLIEVMLEWTNDPNKGLRFACREDAEALARFVDDCEKVTEHIWEVKVHTAFDGEETK